MKRNVPSVSSALILVVLLGAGCASPPASKAKVSYALESVTDGYSVYRVSINESVFKHESSIGTLEVSINENGSIVRVRDFSGLGTFATTGVDHYYCLDESGRVEHLGDLKSSWYVNERSVFAEVGGFHAIRERGE
jgi:hypothetical protein